MTLSQLILLASRRGYMFDERANIAYDGYCFVGVLDDGYSATRLQFDTIADAVRYFEKEER